MRELRLSHLSIIDGAAGKSPSVSLAAAGPLLGGESRFAENGLASPNRGGGKTEGFDGEVYPIPLAERIIVRITRRQNASNKISHNSVYSQYSIRQNAKNPAKIFAGFLLCLIAAACHILLL